MPARPISQIIRRDPDIMGGRPVFRGTRVPIDVLFDNLADGMSLDEVLQEYPTLDRDDVVALLHETPSALAVSDAA